MLQFPETEHLSPNEFSKCRAKEQIILDPALLALQGDNRQECPIQCRWQDHPTIYFKITARTVSFENYC